VYSCAPFLFGAASDGEAPPIQRCSRFHSGERIETQQTGGRSDNCLRSKSESLSRRESGLTVTHAPSRYEVFIFFH
jgi:hypothetical protein